MAQRKQRKLTPKEEQAIKYVLQGKTQSQAVQMSYNCEKPATARALATKIFKKERVNKELALRRVKLQEKLNNKLTTKTAKLIDLIEKFAPPNKVAKRIAENIMSSDKRVSDSAIDKYIRLREGYLPEKRMLLGRSEIYEEIKLLPEENGDEENNEESEEPKESKKSKKESKEVVEPKKE